MIALNAKPRRTPGELAREALRKKVIAGWQRDMAVASIAKSRGITIERFEKLLLERERKEYKPRATRFRSKFGPAEASVDLTKELAEELLEELIEDGMTRQVAISRVASYYGVTLNTVRLLVARKPAEGVYVSPEEIAERCKAIQDGEWKEGAKPWSERDRMNRASIAAASQVETCQFSLQHSSQGPVFDPVGC